MKSLINSGILRLFFIIAATLSVLPCQLHPAAAQAERRFIREGNRLYEKQLFDESELSYRRALDKDEASPQARFNLGNSLFRQERYDEAIRFFGELADDVNDPLNRSKVFHNLGNSMLMSGQVRQGIEAYKEALRNNPGDAETRYNLAFAQHLLDEMKNNPRDGEDNENGDDQNRDGSNDDIDGDVDNDNADDDGAPPDKDNDQQDREEPARRQPDQISAEDALRMLEAAEREEQKVQKKLMEEKASGQQPRTGKIW
jgi:Ca-activated chloride channel homolog